MLIAQSLPACTPSLHLVTFATVLRQTVLPCSSQVHMRLHEHTEQLHRGRVGDWTVAHDVSLLQEYWKGEKVKDIRVGDHAGAQAAKRRLQTLRPVLAELLDAMRLSKHNRASDVHSLILKRLQQPIDDPSTIQGIAAAREAQATEDNGAT